MRIAFSFAVVLVSFTALNVAHAQNALRGGGQPAASGQGAAPGGAEEVPTGQFVPGQPGAAAGGQVTPGSSPSGVPGSQQPGVATDPSANVLTSYALGRNFAMSLKADQVNADLQALIAGISDALTGAQPRFTDQQCGAALQRLQQEMQQKMMARMRQDAAKNQQEEATFLAQNGKRADVQTTPSGLQYRVLQQGQGPSPTLNDVVRCNYRGTLLNGTEFDNSAQNGGPAEFPVKRVIPGWREALPMMHVGEKWQLFVPSKLAYGMGPPADSPIEAGSMLVFEIELLDIVKQ
jgi:FKBP-type peptidyl-prolyl cis-trans isomerase